MDKCSFCSRSIALSACDPHTGYVETLYWLQGRSPSYADRKAQFCGPFCSLAYHEHADNRLASNAGR